MSDLNTGKVIVDQTKTSQVTVNYADTSKPDTSIITSNRTQMTATVDSISTVFEVSKTYYFDADGGLVTTNQGYGTLGTTDSNGVLTVAHSTPSLQDFRIEESESEYRVAEDIHFTAYVNYGNLPSIWTVYAQYSSDGITYEDIQSATVGGSGLANITGCLIPAGASGTIYLRARVSDVYSDPIEALVVVPEIVISAVDVTVDEAFTISGTCNLAKNLRISYAKDPYSSWTVVDNSVTVQPNGTWSVDNVVISETGNFRLKAEYIQDTVSMFSDTEDVVVESGVSMFVVDNSKYIREMNIDDFSLGANLASATTNCFGVATDSDNYYFTDGSGHVVRCYDKATNTLQWTSGTFNTEGSGDNDYNYPCGIDCYGDHLFVADQNNKRIKKIKKSDGSYVSKIALTSTIIGLGELKIDQTNGDIYIATYNTTGSVAGITKITQAGVISTVVTGLYTNSWGFDFYDGHLYLGGLTLYHIKKIRVSDGATIWDKDFSNCLGSYWQVTSVSVVSVTELIANLFKNGTGTRPVKMKLSDGDVTAAPSSAITAYSLDRSAITR